MLPHTLCTLDAQSLTSGSAVLVLVIIVAVAVVVVVVVREHGAALESFQGRNISFYPENRRSLPAGWWGLKKLDEGENWNVVYRLCRGSFVRRIPPRLRVATSCTSFLLRVASRLSFRRDKEKMEGKKCERREGRTKILSSEVILTLSRATTLAAMYYRPLWAGLANFRHCHLLSSLKINSTCPQAFLGYWRIFNSRSRCEN